MRRRSTTLSPGEVHPLGQVLPQESVGVLVGPALPRRVRVAKVDRDVRGECEVSVVGHLRTLVPGNRAPQLLRQGRNGLAHGGIDGLGRAASLQVQEQQEAARTFHERADCAATALAQNDVALPVAWYSTVSGFGWPVGEHDHARQAPALLHAALWTPRGAS